MAQFRHQFQDEIEVQGEENTLPSETQQDELLSIKDMLARHVSGVPVPGHYDGTYDDEVEHADDEYFPSIEEMDLSEIADMRDMLTARVKQIKSEQDKAEKEAEKQRIIEQYQKDNPPKQEEA